MAAYAAGMLGTGIKRRAAQSLAEVATLQLGHPGGDTDFQLLARREGRSELDRRHGGMLREHLGPAKVGIAFGALIDQVLDISGRVVADERALAH
jgi:hypothetical protein